MTTVTHEWEIRETGEIKSIHTVLAREVSERLVAAGLHSIVDKYLHDMGLVLEEAFVNHVKHGNQLDRTKKVSIKASLTDQSLEIESQDEGQGFDPSDVPDPTAVENLERACGRGVFLIDHYMQRRGSYAYLANGTRLKLTFVLSSRQSKESA